MITNLKIDNFKSLKAIDVNFGSMNFIVGPNASGKSNFAEALDFISHVVREDLAYAVAEKGGFYNICYRRQRRARGAIAFSISGTSTVRDTLFDFTLSFELRTRGEDIRADFFVDAERLEISIRAAGSTAARASLQIWRSGPKYEMSLDRYALEPDANLTRSEKNFVSKVESFKKFLSESMEPSSQHLLVSGFLKEFWPISVVAKELGALRVFQLNPRLARQPAAPSVHGDLGRRGENLASALDRMRLRDSRNFKKLSTWLKDVVPTVGKLLTDYTETRQLGLFFEEDGFTSRWFAEDVSDGTIMSVALFLALLDRRHRNVVIEEPETSLHPWILRKFMERAREESQKRQIILTTHSPLVVAQASPSELFLVNRVDGITHISQAIEIEAALPEIIRRDLLDLGEYWLSGGLGAVPRMPDANQSELFGDTEEAGQ